MTRGDQAGPPLSDSASAVFAVLAKAGSATRPQLAARSGLSKPTVSVAMTELESAGLAARSGTAHAGTGRSAAVYHLGPHAGGVLAIDLGSATHAEVRGCTLDGTVLAVQRTDDRLRPADALLTVLGQLPTANPPRAAVVAVPDVASHQPGEAPRPATPHIAAAVEALALPPGTPVHIENNVHCAALAELHEGVARGRTSFGYLQVGYGVGLGIVIDGQVLRGTNAAAGQVARLPYPWAEGHRPRHAGLDEHAGARSLLRRAADAWRPSDGPCPRTAERLFALASDGHTTAGALVADHAREVGRIAAAVAAVLDPGLLVLGGSIGANQQLLPGVRAELDRLSWPTEVMSSVLGGSGTLLGATRLATARGARTVIGDAEDSH